MSSVWSNQHSHHCTFTFSAWLCIIAPLLQLLGEGKEQVLKEWGVVAEKVPWGSNNCPQPLMDRCSSELNKLWTWIGNYLCFSAVQLSFWGHLWKQQIREGSDKIWTLTRLIFVICFKHANFHGNSYIVVFNSDLLNITSQILTIWASKFTLNKILSWLHCR